ncbi:MAG: o-succinylbenzoate---CoA ligase [Acidimicrobiaceae bacterium]|nr:o-succinylbenzoate---CoA ligase [Acidimicrobiaceae bacterium]
MTLLVAVDLPGGPAFVDALQRAWDAGEAVLPLDQRLAVPARQEVLDALAPGAIVDGSGRRLRAGGRPVADGDALVVATSGTTGPTKGVVLTHAAVAASASATSARLGVDPQRHRWLACLPLSHVGGLSVVTRALLTGTALEVHPGFDVAAVVAAAGPQVLVSLVPTALRRVGAERFGTVVLGGSTPPPRHELAPNVVTTYGMTETGSGVVYDGVPLEGVEVAIGEGGEVRLRGPMLLRAYRDGTVPLDAEGWFATGDAGAVGSDGRLVIRGRLSDLIISGGENVWPAAVEAILRCHPGVAEVVVAGRPDPEWGERVVAWVVPADPVAPLTLESLRALVKEQLAPWAAPRQLVLLDSLPKTSLGKVRRQDL